LFGVGLRYSRLRLFLWLDSVSATTTAPLPLVAVAFCGYLSLMFFVLFILEPLVILFFFHVIFRYWVVAFGFINLVRFSSISPKWLLVFQMCWTHLLI
jgi:hypothetical protein